MASESKQRLILSLSPGTLQKAKILATRRSTTVGELVSQLIEELVSNDDHYERNRQAALKLMNQGLHLGGGRPLAKEYLHER